MKTLIAAALIAATAAPACADSAFIDSANINTHRAISVDACKDVRTAKYALEAYDSINTARAFAAHSYYHERDPLSRIGVAVGGRTFGVALTMIALDIVTDALTRRTPALRCALDARQALANMSGVINTNANREMRWLP